MRNLYFKKYSMNKLAKPTYTLKAVLLFFMLGVCFLTYTFAQNRVFFSPSNIYPILNTVVVWTATDLKITTTTGVEWYGVDVYDQSQWAGQQHPNDQLSVSTNVRVPNITYISAPNYWGNMFKNTYYTWVYAGYDTNSAAPYATFSNTSVGKLNIINLWTNYLTSAYIGYYTWVSSVTNIDLIWQATTAYDSLSWLNIYFWACPAIKDSTAPTFPNNQTTIDTNPEFPDRQINRQNRDDFLWTFWLLDNTNPTSNNNGWMATPDFDAGTNFRPNASNGYNSGITNQHGINSWSFIVQIKVASGWNHSTAQTAWSSWASTNILTNAAWIAFTPWGKTWRYLDKNYTWDIEETNYISGFGIEELVMISWYVEDRDMGYPWFNATQTWDTIKGYSYRSGKNSTNFVYYFNQGMRPWFNTTTAWSYTHTPNCILDIEHYQTGFAIKTISGYLRDDWAGIDTSTVEIVITGTIVNSIQTKTYTLASDPTKLALSIYSSTGTGCRTDAGTYGVSPWGNSVLTYPGDWTVVCDDWTKASTGNYNVVLSDTSRSYDPEDPLYVTINYKDLKGKQWRPVTCSWWAEKAPRFVWSGFFVLSDFLAKFSELMVLSNYPYGALVKNIALQLQDDWAGVDIATIVWSLHGNTLDTPTTISGVSIDLAYNSNLYTQVWWPTLWTGDTYPNITSQGYIWYLINGISYTTYYRNWLNLAVNDIPSFQQLNYQLSLGQTGAFSSFTGYFAPEQNINLSLTFKDKDSDGWSGKTVYNPINITYTNNEAPVFWEYIKTTNFTWGVDKKLIWGNDPIGNSLTGEMAKLFSGATGVQRIFPYDLTGDTISQLGPIKQTDIAFKTTDNRAGVDSGSIVLTITWNRRWMPYVYVFTASKLDFTAFDRGDIWSWNLLNYLSILANHNIYFDRQSRWGSAPVLWRESRYTINIQADDLKQPTANTTNVSFTRDMENLSCQYLDRCNARLYFTYRYNWLSEPVEPVVRTWVHPFLWQTLYVIASWDKIIYTGVNENYIACNGAGTLISPITIDFQNGLLAWWETDPYTNYQYSELVVMDGMFEITGTTLVLK